MAAAARRSIRWQGRRHARWLARRHWWRGALESRGEIPGDGVPWGGRAEVGGEVKAAFGVSDDGALCERRSCALQLLPLTVSRFVPLARRALLACDATQVLLKRLEGRPCLRRRGIASIRRSSCTEALNPSPRSGHAVRRLRARWRRGHAGRRERRLRRTHASRRRHKSLRRRIHRRAVGRTIRRPLASG